MRIAMAGAGGTGKSTLVTAMTKIWEEEFENYMVIDTVRHPDHLTMTQKERQTFLNKVYREYHLTHDFISSRSAYDVYTYSRLTVDMWYEWVQWQGFLKKVDYDFLFYLPIEFDTVPNADGTRPLRQSDVEGFQLELQKVLNFYHVPFNIVSGTIEERLETIRKIMRLPYGNYKSDAEDNA